MNQQQHLRLLAIDAAGGGLPLPFRLPHGEAIRKPPGHFVAKEDLPLELADRAFRPRQPEVERRADLGSGQHAAFERDGESLCADWRWPVAAHSETSGE